MVWVPLRVAVQAALAGSIVNVMAVAGLLAVDAVLRGHRDAGRPAGRTGRGRRALDGAPRPRIARARRPWKARGSCDPGRDNDVARPVERGAAEHRPGPRRWMFRGRSVGPDLGWPAEVRPV